MVALSDILILERIPAVTTSILLFQLVRARQYVRINIMYLLEHRT